MKVIVDVDLCNILDVHVFDEYIGLEELKSIVQEKAQRVINNVIYSKDIWDETENK